MIFIWRGWGMLALVVLFPVLASCAGMLDDWPMGAVLLTTCVLLFAGGAVCIRCGTRWNRDGVRHSLYFVPLEVWGWVYVGHVFVVSLLSASSAAVNKRLTPTDRVARGVGGAGGGAAVAGLVLVYRRRPERPGDESAESTDDDTR